MYKLIYKYVLKLINQTINIGYNLFYNIYKPVIRVYYDHKIKCIQFLCVLIPRYLFFFYV
jgi:hypothetical protein